MIDSNNSCSGARLEPFEPDETEYREQHEF